MQPCVELFGTQLQPVPEQHLTTQAKQQAAAHRETSALIEPVTLLLKHMRPPQQHSLLHCVVRTALALRRRWQAHIAIASVARRFKASSQTSCIGLHDRIPASQGIPAPSIPSKHQPALNVKRCSAQRPDSLGRAGFLPARGSVALPHPAACRLYRAALHSTQRLRGAWQRRRRAKGSVLRPCPSTTWSFGSPPQQGTTGAELRASSCMAMPLMQVCMHAGGGSWLCAHRA